MNPRGLETEGFTPVSNPKCSVTPVGDDTNDRYDTTPEIRKPTEKKKKI